MDVHARARQTTGPGTTHAFLVLRDDAAIVGDNIASVFYVRDSASPTGWASFAWESQDQWAAIEWVKQEYGIGAAMDERWQTQQPQPISPVADEPLPFEDGVLEGDPFAPILQIAPNRDEIVDLLVSLGYEAADVPGEDDEFQSSCPNQAVVGIFAAGIDAGEAGGDVISAITPGMIGCFGFCLPLTQAGPASQPSCAAPGPYGAPVQGIGVPYVTCTYSRTRTCSQTRIVVSVSIDCGWTLCQQSRSRVETESHTCDDSGTLYNGPGIAPDPCPLVPSCFGTTQSSTFVATSVGAWSAWAPACP